MFKQTTDGFRTGPRPRARCYHRMLLLLSTLAVVVLNAAGSPACSREEPEARILALVSTEFGHSHGADITYRAVRSGLRRFHLREANGHSHAFDLTQEQMGTLELGFPVVVDSTEEQVHRHAVTIQKQADL